MIDPDAAVHAAADAIAKEQQRAVLDARDEPMRLATAAILAARPKMWLRAQQTIEELTQQVTYLEGQLAQKGTGLAYGGVCPSCGNLLH